MTSRSLTAVLAMLVALIAAAAVFLAFADLTSSGQSSFVTALQAALIFSLGAVLGAVISRHDFLLPAAGVWLSFWLLLAGVAFSIHPENGYPATFLSMWPGMLGSALSVLVFVKVGEWLASKLRPSHQSGAT